MTVWLEIIAFHPLPVVGTTPWLCSPRFHSIMHPPAFPSRLPAGTPTPKPRGRSSYYYFPACGPRLSLPLSFALSSAFLAREKPPPSSVGFSAAIARDSEGCGRRSEGSRIRTARSRATKARSAANFTTDAAFFRRAISFLSNLAVERVDLRRGRKKRFHTKPGINYSL